MNSTERVDVCASCGRDGMRLVRHHIVHNESVFKRIFGRLLESDNNIARVCYFCNSVFCAYATELDTYESCLQEFLRKCSHLEGTPQHDILVCRWGLCLWQDILYWHKLGQGLDGLDIPIMERCLQMFPSIVPRWLRHRIKLLTRHLEQEVDTGLWDNGYLPVSMDEEETANDQESN